MSGPDTTPQLFTSSDRGKALAFKPEDAQKILDAEAKQIQNKLKEINSYWDHARDVAQKGSGSRVDADLRRALEIQKQQPDHDRDPERQIDIAIKLELYEQASVRTQWKLEAAQEQEKLNDERVRFTDEEIRNISAREIADWVQQEMIPAFEKTKEEKPDTELPMRHAHLLPSIQTSFPIDRWIKNANALYDSLNHEASK